MEIVGVTQGAVDVKKHPRTQSAHPHAEVRHFAGQLARSGTSAVLHQTQLRLRLASECIELLATQGLILQAFRHATSWLSGLARRFPDPSPGSNRTLVSITRRAGSQTSITAWVGRPAAERFRGYCWNPPSNEWRFQPDYTVSSDIGVFVERLLESRLHPGTPTAPVSA